MDQVTASLTVSLKALTLGLLITLGYEHTNSYADGVVRMHNPALDLAVFVRPDGSVGDPHTHASMIERTRLSNAGVTMRRESDDTAQLRENLRHAQRQIDSLQRTLDENYLRGDDRALIKASMSVYELEIRKACEEDQGNPDGDEGTLGHETQCRLRELRAHPAFRAV